MKFWQSIIPYLLEHNNLVLLYVVQSQGSSPGRQGFKMLVSQNSWMTGSIGGGPMEYKLVELAKALLKDGSFNPFLKKQIHRSNEARDRSGMICSGEQTVAFYYLDKSTIRIWNQLITDLNTHKNQIVKLDENGIFITNGKNNNRQFTLQIDSQKKWSLEENIGFKAKIYIIGAGHVGLALTQIMHLVDFHVILLDDRPDLNTLTINQYADEKILVDYKQIQKFIPEDPQNYIVLMSFGYKTDKIIISNLVDHKCKYFGVMGSKAKMDKLFGDLETEGFDISQLNKIYSPIGLQINSQTPMEIAVSIAAQIIQIKNRT